MHYELSFFQIRWPLECLLLFISSFVFSVDLYLSLILDTFILVNHPKEDDESIQKYIDRQEQFRLSCEFLAKMDNYIVVKVPAGPWQLWITRCGQTEVSWILMQCLCEFFYYYKIILNISFFHFFRTYSTAQNCIKFPFFVKNAQLWECVIVKITVFQNNFLFDQTEQE